MRSIVVLASAAILGAVGSWGLYTPGRTAVTLISSKKEFAQEVTKFDGVALVEFYAPWCGHCKNLVPEWEKAAKALKGVAKVVAVDATEHAELASKYGVRGYPTIKVFGADKRSPSDYQGGRTAKEIVSGAKKAIGELLGKRMGGSGGSKGRKEQGGGKRRASASEPGGGKHVIQLTADNFDAMVLDSDEEWLVEFFAPWCGHCKTAAPEFAAAAEQLEGEVRVGAVDATQEQALASRFGVKGFPTFKLFPAGEKRGDGSAVDYNGPREADAFVSFAMEKLAASGGGGGGGPKELVSDEVFAKTCKGKRLCVVGFLPDLRDDGAATREKRIATLATAAKADARLPVRVLWVEQNAQPELQAAVGVTMVPAAVAINREKKVFASHVGAFDQQGLKRFVSGIASGRISSQPFQNDIPSIRTKEPWDGNDAPTEEEPEEEFSLDDIMGEDIGGDL